VLNLESFPTGSLKHVYIAADIFTKLPETASRIARIHFAAISEAHYAMLAELRRFHPKTKVIFLCDGADQTKLIDPFSHGPSRYL